MAEIFCPPGYRTVIASADVVAEAAAHLRDVFVAQSGRPLLSVGDYVEMLTSPHFDRRFDVVLLADDRGIVGQAVVLNRAPYTNPTCLGVVSPVHCGKGLGSALVAWAEARARERVCDAPDGARVAVACFVDAMHEPSIDLVSDHGFAVERFFMTMQVEFSGPPKRAEFPPDLELHTFTDDVLEVVARTRVEAFRDHYGHIERPFDETLSEVRHAVDRPGFDASLWWHVRAGDDVVATCWGADNHGGDDTVGYVRSLGVRAPWRGRGIATNLLLHAFGVFHSRGLVGGALDVDTQSLTGAARLFESVGMSETYRNALYVKELRPGEDLAMRSLI